MNPQRRKILLVSGAGAAIVACILTGYLLSGPGQAKAPDDAIRAAESIRKELAGTTGHNTQPTNDQGVPRDAQIDPAAKSGRVVTTKKP